MITTMIIIILKYPQTLCRGDLVIPLHIPYGKGVIVSILKTNIIFSIDLCVISSEKLHLFVFLFNLTIWS